LFEVTRNPQLETRNIMYMNGAPKITVGILDRQTEIKGRLNGPFEIARSGSLSGDFSARCDRGEIIVTAGGERRIFPSETIPLNGEAGASFTLSHVVVGNSFHWQRTEEQIFGGDLMLRRRPDETLAAINRIGVEDYLVSVVCSEMSAAAPPEFLKAHAILSRSWLLAALRRRGGNGSSTPRRNPSESDGTVIRWYGREDHELFDVCADDHCQRYQGMTRVFTPAVEVAVRGTSGVVLMYNGEICDTRYSKACGGITERYETAWEDRDIPYLQSVPDSAGGTSAVRTEEEARRWILASPEAYCRSEDDPVLKTLLPELDQKTTSFYRWEVRYRRTELEHILMEKSGLDFGTLQDLIPLERGPSGRIVRLKIIGSKRTVVVGKELEIRRWLSPTHLYSSAFVVRVDENEVAFRGAGWGHGVGLCQIGAAIMATRGYSAEEILRHYFSNVELQKIY
jgi:stage II sporulation protein D